MNIIQFKKFICFLVVFILFCLVVPIGCVKNDGNHYFTRLLGSLPISAKESGGFILIDYDRCLKDAGLSLNHLDDQKINRENLKKLYKAKYAEGKRHELQCISLGSYYTGHSIDTFVSPITYDNVGYDFSCVDAEITNIYQFHMISSFFNDFHFSKDVVVSAIGDFNADTIETALNNQNDWPSWAIDQFSKEKYQDTVIYSWGDSLENHSSDRLSPPHLDKMGRAVPFSIFDHQFFCANSIDYIKSMIDVKKQNSHSLANVPEYALIVKQMENLNVPMMIVADASLTSNSFPSNKFQEDPLLKHFTTFGTGYGKDEKGTYIAIILYHDNPVLAKENASLLEQRISNSFFPKSSDDSELDITWVPGSTVISNYDIDCEENLLQAKLYTQDHELWYKWFCLRGNLLIHES